MNEENLRIARANDGMVGVGKLEIIPQIQEDEFEHEKISEEGDEMDDREELPAVTAVESHVVNSEWDDGIDMMIGENEESGSDGSGSDSSGSDSSGSEGNWDEGADNEGSGNEKNDE
ncbi:hypothetical protein Bca4012_092354 [Brassica carinata]